MNYSCPVLSIIVPVYNTMNYLEKCLYSLISQKLQNIEILVINDGSKDNSLHIMYNFFLKYPNIIKIFNIPHGGLSAARNLGIINAKGMYIGFVDSDDWVEYNMYFSMVKYIIKYKADISICNIIKQDIHGNILHKIEHSYHDDIEYINLKKDFSLFSELSCFACNKVFKKTLFNNMLFLENLYFEDIATIGSIFLKANKIVKINRLYYHYIKRLSSITNSYDVHYLDMYKSISIVKKNFI